MFDLSAIYRTAIFTDVKMKIYKLKLKYCDIFLTFGSKQFKHRLCVFVRTNRLRTSCVLAHSIMCFGSFNVNG